MTVPGLCLNKATRPAKWLSQKLIGGNFIVTLQIDDSFINHPIYVLNSTTLDCRILSKKIRDRTDTREDPYLGWPKVTRANGTNAVFPTRNSPGAETIRAGDHPDTRSIVSAGLIVPLNMGNPNMGDHGRQRFYDNIEIDIRIIIDTYLSKKNFFLIFLA